MLTGKCIGCVSQLMGLKDKKISYPLTHKNIDVNSVTVYMDICCLCSNYFICSNCTSCSKKS